MNASGDYIDVVMNFDLNGWGNLMKNKQALLLGAVLAGSCAAAHAEFSGTMDLVSDYDFRGASQSDRGPAVQLGGEYGHESGFYAGVWGSTVDFFDEIDVEVDFYVGFGTEFSEGVELDVVLNRYMYPTIPSGIDFDYNELIATLTFAESMFVQLGYSNDVFASDETGLYYAGGSSWSIPWDLTLDARLGYYDLDDAVGDSYLEWTLGLTRSFEQFDMSLRYHDTDSNGEDIFGSAAKARLALGLHFAF